MKAKKFTATYIALFGYDLENCVRFSKFKTVDEFKTYLKDNNLKYDVGNGEFNNTEDVDLNPSILICEKAYYEKTGVLADWDHVGLYNYLNNRLSGIAWVEDCESIWVSCGRYELSDDENIELIFNDIKSFDCVEIELEYDEDDFEMEEMKYTTPKIM